MDDENDAVSSEKAVHTQNGDVCIPALRREARELKRRRFGFHQRMYGGFKLKRSTYPKRRRFRSRSSRLGRLQRARKRRRFGFHQRIYGFL